MSYITMSQRVKRIITVPLEGAWKVIGQTCPLYFVIESFKWKAQCSLCEGTSAPGASLQKERVPEPFHTAAEGADNVILSSKDPVADTGLEVGDVTTSKPNDGVGSVSVPAAKCTVLVIRLSYNKPVELSDQPLVIVHQGIKICVTCDAGKYISESLLFPAVFWQKYQPFSYLFASLLIVFLLASVKLTLLLRTMVRN